MQSDRMTLARLAKEMGFVRDTIEKVCRLIDVLRFLEEDDLLSNHLALKGGTAINLTIFDLPRLSVDIDLDYCKSARRDEMLSDREIITNKIGKYMTAKGYAPSPKGKSYHALDSFVYEYVNSGGAKDNLKIEINYMLRCHVLPVSKKEVKLPWNQNRLTVLSVAPVEIFASKMVALLNRAAPRDLYDVYNMVRYGLFDKNEEEMLRKCTVFYSAIGAEHPPVKFNLNHILEISKAQIKRDLYPVLQKGEIFDLEMVQKEVVNHLASIMIPTNGEKAFWSAFAKGDYSPELVFGEGQETENILNHPMALWKCEKNKRENARNS